MIKQVNANDQSVATLSQSCFNKLSEIYKPTEKAKRNKAKNHNDWTCFGFYHNERLVGVVEVKLLDLDLQISSLAVNSAYRRQGIARRLIEFAISRFNGLRTISVWCVQQTGNVSIFNALGFQVVQEFESDYFELVDGSQAIEVQLKKQHSN